LVEQKFLRKAYTDPMVEDGEWKVLRQLSPEVRRMMNPAARAGGTPEQRGGLSQSQRKTQRSTTTRSSRSRLGGSAEQGLGGIVGVVSTSEEESIRVIDGKNHYNEWIFVYVQQVQGTRRPGLPGRQQPDLGGRQPGLGGQQPGLGGQPPGARRPRGMQPQGRRQPRRPPNK
jgi:hypothetical protein